MSRDGIEWMAELREEAPFPALLILLALPVFVYGMASHGIVTSDEAYYHGIAEHMVESGSWGEVVFRGTPSLFDTFMNAPLQYWSRAVLISAFGSNYYTLRALSALLSIASILATYAFVRYFVGRRAGLVAGMVQLTTFQLVYMHAGRSGVIEPFVTLFMTLGAFAFARFLETGRGLFAHHLCLIALVNLKTPVVLVPVLAEIACFAAIPTAGRFVRWLGWGVVAAPIGLAWHLFHMGHDLDGFRRVAGDMAAQGARAGGGFFARRLSNAYYYGSSILFGAFPYVLLYPVAATDTMRRFSGTPRGRAFAVALAYALAILLFFVLVGKRYHWYIIPAIPFFSMFVGVWLEGLSRRSPNTISLVWLAFAVAALFTFDVQMTSVNPFMIISDTMLVGPNGGTFLEVRSFAWLAALTAALAVAFVAASRRLGQRFAAPFAAALGVAFLAFGAVRVVAPLGYVDYVSVPEQVRRRIDASRSLGRPLEPPVRVSFGQPLGWVARFYFANEFELVPTDRGYLLFPLGTPWNEIEAELARIEERSGQKPKRRRRHAFDRGPTALPPAAGPELEVNGAKSPSGGSPSPR